MRKPIVMLEIQRAPDGEGAYRMAERIGERRLQRRMRAAERDPEIVGWFRTALDFWRLNKDGPDDDFEEGFPGLFLGKREPRIADHPRFPKDLHRTEMKRIEAWCSDRVKKARRPGHPLSEKLPEAEKKEIRDAAEGMSAVYITEHEIDVAFSDIHKHFPWLEMLTEKAWRQARTRARSGLPAGVGPMLLLGPPGIGKSSWARAVAETLGVPRLDIDVGATGGVFDLQGTAKGWGGADRGRLMATIIATRTANPMIIMDEIDAGSSRNGLKGGGSLPGLFKSLMGLIEPSTAVAWVCPYYQVPVDMRHVSWIATSNGIAHIEQALLDRMTIIDLPDMTRDQLLAFAAVQAKLRFDNDVAEIVVYRVRDSLRHGHRLSLRHVIKILDRLQEAIERPILH